MSKNLIIYYSRRGENYVNGEVKELERGNTEVVVDFLQAAAEADVFRVETVEDYPADYYECIEVAKAETKAGARPALKAYLDSLEGYDNVFVCGPIWWGTYPMALFSLLERLDWKGKTVLPLTTHAGSGLASCERDLKKLCKGAKVVKGLAVPGAEAAASERTVTDWAGKHLGARR